MSTLLKEVTDRSVFYSDSKALGKIELAGGQYRQKGWESAGMFGERSPLASLYKTLGLIHHTRAENQYRTSEPQVQCYAG